MHRDFKESEEHRRLIVMMVEHFKRNGFKDIKADITGMKAPNVIVGFLQNHKPDLTAEINGKEIILEAETVNSISDEHTKSQWTLFADAAIKNGGEFHLVVPSGYRNVAEQRARLIGVKIDTIWTPQ